MRILYLVDCQKDFMDKDGALYVPGAEEIKENIVKLLDEQWDIIIYSLDTHYENYKNTEEGKMFPEHCIVGTEGHELFDELKEALKKKKNIIPVIELRKNVFDVWTHKENKRLLKKLINDEDKVVFAGVATNYCVFYAMKGMHDNINCKIDLRMDCTKPIKDDSYDQTMKTIEYFLNGKNYLHYDNVNDFVREIINPNMKYHEFDYDEELIEVLKEMDVVNEFVKNTNYDIIQELYYKGLEYMNRAESDPNDYTFDETIIWGIAQVLQDCSLITLKIDEEDEYYE